MLLSKQCHNLRGSFDLIRRLYSVKEIPFGGKKNGFLLGVGFPIMDYHVDISDDDVISSLSGMNVEPDVITTMPENDIECNKAFDQFIMAASEKHFLTERSITPGGAVQNAIRSAQWILGGQKRTAFVGKVGKDSVASRMTDLVQKEQVTVVYQIDSKLRTAQCLSIESPSTRTQICRLGAASKLTLDFLVTPIVEELIEKATIIYMGGYMWQYCPDLIMRLASICSNRRDKKLALNLHSPHVCRLLAKPEFEFVLSTLDYIFGSSADAMELACQLALTASERRVRERFAEFLNLPVPMPDMVERVALYLSQMHKSNDRCVVFSQGSHGHVVAAQGDRVVRYNVMPLPEEKFADPVGCGDALIGGFLAMSAVNGRSLQSGLSAGVYAARSVAMQIGCTFPNKAQLKSSDESYESQR